MEYQIAQPSHHLAKFIKQYWAIENCYHYSQEHIQRIVPNGLMELSFYLGDKPVSNDSRKSIDENTIITGHLRDFYDIKVSGKLNLFAIEFKPHGLSRFFDIPLNEFYNQSVPLSVLFKNETSELETKLFESKSFAERVRVVEAFFIRKLVHKVNSNHFARIAHSIYFINQTRGKVDVESLASEACMSRKQFERIFSAYVGSTPKQFLKTIRFQNSLDSKAKNLTASLTDLTYSCGYYDQSHMINDFKQLTGLSPKKYFEECEPYSDYFL